MNCKWCGKKIAQNSKFCPNCGKEILEDSSSNINQCEHSTEPEVVNSFNQEGINSVEECLACNTFIFCTDCRSYNFFSKKR